MAGFPIREGRGPASRRAPYWINTTFAPVEPPARPVQVAPMAVELLTLIAGDEWDKAREFLARQL